MTLSTRSIVSRILFLIGSLLSSTSLVAATLSFSGDFTQDDQVELFSFSVDVPSLVLINTYSYNGGGQANGNNVSSGGFDPLLALFDSTGALIKQDDDSGEESDAQIFILLEPGDYTASLAQLENFANGPNLSDGFSRAGESDYTGVEFGPGSGTFYDFNGAARTRAWALDIENVSAPPPVPLCDLPPVPVSGICARTVVARSAADIDSYIASDFGRTLNLNGKQVFKHLRLIGSIGEAGQPLIAISPCSITVNAAASITGSDVVLHARQGLKVNWSADIDASGEACLIADKQHVLLNGNNVVNANTLAIRSAKKAIVGFRSSLNVTGAAEVTSTGSGWNSQAKLANKARVTAESFALKADNFAELAFQAEVSTTGRISIRSGGLATSKTTLANRSSVQSGIDIVLESGGRSRVGFHTTVSAAGDLHMKAKATSACSVANVSSITYASKSGNCADKLP